MSKAAPKPDTTEEWRGRQGNHTLTLVGHQNPSVAQMDTFNRYVPALLKAAIGESLVSVEAFHVLVGLDYPLAEGVLEDDRRMDGWRLEDHIPRGLKGQHFDFKKPTKPVHGTDLPKHFCCDWKRRRYYGGAGQEDLEYLLKHQKAIPVDMRGRLIVFPKTVWVDGKGTSLFPVAWFDTENEVWVPAYRPVWHHYNPEEILFVEDHIPDDGF